MVSATPFLAWVSAGASLSLDGCQVKALVPVLTGWARAVLGFYYFPGIHCHGDPSFSVCCCTGINIPPDTVLCFFRTVFGCWFKLLWVGDLNPASGREGLPRGFWEVGEREAATSRKCPTSFSPYLGHQGKCRGSLGPLRGEPRMAQTSRLTGTMRQLHQTASDPCVCPRSCGFKLNGAPEIWCERDPQSSRARG